MVITDLENQILLKPNCSLTPKAAITVIMFLAATSLLVAFGFMNIGAWLVLPFAGLELIAIAYAFYIVQLHASDFECITITEDSVVIEKRYYKTTTKTVFQRYWAQVNLRGEISEKTVNGKRGLFVGSHGKEVEFGEKFINNEQRALLARELKQKLKNIY